MKKIDTTIPLPNFLLVGAAKCGTTSLYHYLRQHPEIFMSQAKEPRFFSNLLANPGTGPGDALISQRSIGSFETYLGLFKQSSGKKAAGEASVDSLFHFKQTIPAIQRYLGDPRIIIILRDPVKRAYSAYNFLVRDGRENLSFKDALLAEEQRKQDGYVFIWQYKEGGLYADRVEAFQSNFSQVQVLLYDELTTDALALMRSVYAFLHVNQDFIPDMSHLHNISGIPRWKFFNNLFLKPKRLHKIVRTIGGATLGADRWIRLRERIRSIVLKKPQQMDPEIEQQLRRYYRQDILKLQDIIDRDLSSWLVGSKF